MSEYGLWRNRSCTDILLLILFLAFIGGFAVVAAIAFANGNPTRLVRGTDFAGNSCGVSPNPNQPSDTYLKTNLDGSPWSERKYLWYPIMPNVDPKKFASMGICMKGCPKGPSISLAGVDLTNKTTYANYSKYIQEVVSYAVPNQPEVKYPVLFESEPVLYRCVPQGSTNLAIGLAQAVTEFEPFVVGSQFLYRQIVEVSEAWRVILICFFGTVVIAFLFVWFLRFLVGPLLAVTMLAAVGILAILGYVLWFQGDSVIKLVPTDDRYRVAFKVCAIVCWVIDVLLILVVIFLFKNIRIAVEIIQMGSRVFSNIMTLILVPPIFCLLSLGVFVLCATVWLYLKTSVTLQPITIPIPIIGQPAPVTNVMTTVVSQSRSKDWLILYDVFGFFWLAAFLHAYCFLVLALCATTWYFSEPGDSKKLPALPILASLWTVLRYHIGTIAFGSLIIAIIRFVRFLLSRIQKKFAAWAGPGGCIAGCFLCCVQCCLAYWERVIAYISKNAYIVTAIDGSNFIFAAGKAVSLILDNLVRLATLSLIADFILFLAKLLITAATVVVGWLLLTKTSLGKSVDTVVLPLIVIGILAYIVSTLFVGVYSALADTLIVSFCYDMDVNNGTDKPYYATSDLQRIMGKYNAKSPASPAPPEVYDPMRYPQYEIPQFVPNQGNLHPSPMQSQRNSGNAYDPMNFSYKPEAVY